jgi:hypothetical protein
MMIELAETEIARDVGGLSCGITFCGIDEPFENDAAK